MTEYTDTRKEERKINFHEAEKFLTMLDEENLEFTFVMIEEPKPEIEKAKINLHHGSFEYCREILSKANKGGQGVFFTVNRTDGKGRKTDNVLEVRALFVDLDGADLEPVISAPLSPHIIIESSPRRFHAYWIVENVPLDQFGALQKELAHRFNGDSSVNDLPRLMRLPGFYHLKGVPFRSRIIETSGTLPYSYEEFAQKFPPKKESFQQRQGEGVLEVLRKKKLIIKCEDQRIGRWLIECPWKSEHTGGGATAYYYEGKDQKCPHEGFKCFHQHCSHRSIHDLRSYCGVENRVIGDPLPLYRRIKDPMTYPVDALGPILGAAAKSMHEIIRAPIEICGQSVLAAASLLTQGHANVAFDGRVTPLTLFKISVAETGERKSAVDEVALSAVFKYQEMQCKTYREEYRRYEREKDVWDARHKKWKEELKLESPGGLMILNQWGR